MDLVTVVVPIYNVEKFLERCIKSIISQTYKNVEILLVNDGSPDNSKAIMEEYAKKDKRIKCFYKENGGLSDARNYAIKRAKGKYICFIDSDDYIENNYVEKLYNSCKKNDSEISWCNLNKVNDSGIIGKIIQTPDDLWSFEMASACNKLFLTELFAKNNIEFPKGIWYEDLATTPRLIFMSKNISWVNEELYNYYYNSESITKTFTKKIMDMRQVINIDYEFVKEKGMLENKKIYNIMEYIFLYGGLLDTSFRACMSNEVSLKELKDMISWIEKKFPNIYKNDIAKQRLNFKRKLILFLVKHKLYFSMKTIIRLGKRRK